LQSLLSKKTQVRSIREAARVYNVPESTLRNRLRGRVAQRGSRNVNRKLRDSEETALIQWIESMEKRGFAPHIIDVKRMAEALLLKRGSHASQAPIGRHWVYRFLEKHPQLRTRLSRKLDSQRARCEDPELFKAWFQRVQQAIELYGILDEDIYNVDETGFAMGLTAGTGASKSVTTGAIAGRIVTIQPGNREWVTTIECINAKGWTVPPFIIVKAKVQMLYWYSENRDLPPSWVIAMSDNGWTNDKLGFAWIQHFNRHTSSRTVGNYRLLLFDGHSSHGTPEFDLYCQENRIVTLCLPAHSSHKLQPLDVACFSPLKTAYRNRVEELARCGCFHIDKSDFLGIYPLARKSVFSASNIASGFRATGLLPHDPERVLQTLTFTKTPSPPSSSHGLASSPWSSETPKNVTQVEKQHRFVRNSFGRPSQSQTEALAKLAKSAEYSMSAAVILARENAELRAANERLSRKKSRQHTQLPLSDFGDVQEAHQHLQDRVEARRRVADEALQRDCLRAPRTCSLCKLPGHNSRTCSIV
jgi:hypothetical protein